MVRRRADGENSGWRMIAINQGARARALDTPRECSFQSGDYMRLEPGQRSKIRDPTENAFKARSSLADNRMPRLPHADGHQEGHHRWAGYEDRHRRLHLRDLPN